LSMILSSLKFIFMASSIGIETDFKNSGFKALKPLLFNFLKFKRS
jgi:hypothetical protein